MEVSDGESPARVVNDRIYVAVGRDVRESKSTLLWALENFGGDFRIIHVRQPHLLNPSSRSFHGSGSRNHQELAMQEMNSILDEYIHICNQAEVHAAKRFLDMQDIGKGILELIEQHAITKLVMGAAADRRYFEGMSLTSTKAKFINQHAPPSCHIWFVCNGHLIYSREGDLNPFDMDFTPSVPGGSSLVESGLQNLRSPLGSFHSRSNSSEVEGNLASVRHERHEGNNYSSESNSSHAYEGYSQNPNYTGMLQALEHIYNEQLRARKDLEESLAIEKEAYEALKTQHEELEMLFEDALRANNELLANQTSEPSPSAYGHDFISEFSWYELEEATNSFNRSLKIDEGDYGSTYKGLLHHTQVAVKMMRTGNYHPEVQLATKSRHPNLVTLIGVSPDASALIYEYLPNGSLEDQLSARDTGNHLSWQIRIRICADTCAALMFLHSCHGMAHGNLKPGNILLDVNFMAKITNFGLRSAPSDSLTTGGLSLASDVYSFGNVLLRLLTGRSALNLDEMMQNALDVGNLGAMLDPTAGRWPFELATELAHLALSCRDSKSDNRPDLGSQVWPVLEQMRTQCEASLSSRLGPEEPSEPPHHFLCPISQEIMQDPHVAADGFTYEASEIRRWLSDHDTSPMTGCPLSVLDLFPNQTVRSMIQEWLQNH